MASRAVTPESLGAWVLKASPRVGAVEELVATGFRSVTARCVRPTYRAGLVAAGQPVLFWVSGGLARIPAGIYARGRTTGPATVSEAEAEEPGLVMPVRLEALATPVLRRELLAHPVLRAIEVLRMPAGSNPSFLTRDQVAELDLTWPQLDVAS